MRPRVAQAAAYKSINQVKTHAVKSAMSLKSPKSPKSNSPKSTSLDAVALRYASHHPDPLMHKYNLESEDKS